MAASQKLNGDKKSSKKKKAAAEESVLRKVKEPGKVKKSTSKSKSKSKSKTSGERSRDLSKLPDTPPLPLLDLVYNFLKSFKFKKGFKAIKGESKKRIDVKAKAWRGKSNHIETTLVQIFDQWQSQQHNAAHATAAPVVESANSLKRKASEISESEPKSDSDSESSASSSISVVEASTASDGLASTKKSKTVSGKLANGSKSTNSTSEPSKSKSKDEKVASPTKVASSTKKPALTNGAPPREINSESPTVPKKQDAVTAKVASKESLSGSEIGSDSESASDGESSSDDEPGSALNSEDEVAPKKQEKKPEQDKSTPEKKGKKAKQDTSASNKDENKTEAKKSEVLVYKEPSSEQGEAKVVAATDENFKMLKKQKIPYSRIPADIKVDEKFSSNAYQPYDYANKAHQDLIVTKGKAFTKQKQKGKRGSYKGGAIDASGGRGIKFDD